MDTKFSPALNKPHVPSFEVQVREEQNNHGRAQQVQNRDNGKSKDKTSQPSWPCEPCSPWGTPDPSCEPSHLLCRWKVNLLQMSWHGPKSPGLQHQVLEPVKMSSPQSTPDNSQSSGRSLHVSGAMKPKVAQLCCTAVSVEILGVSRVLLNLSPNNHLLFYPWSQFCICT